MNTIQSLAGETNPEAFAQTASMALEHLGNLFGFLDAKLGELVIFDPEARVKENVIREAIKVGSLVCGTLVADGRDCGATPERMRELWQVLVEEAVRRSAGAN